MELPRSILVYQAGNGEIAPDQVEMSAGIGPAPLVEAPQFPYLEGAFMPRMPWRPPLKQELEALFTRERPADLNLAVGLLTAPAEVMEPFRRLRIAEVTSIREFRALIGTAEGTAAVNGALAFANSLRTKEEPLDVIRIYNDPGLPSTAFNPALSSYVGLHVDSRDQQSAGSRRGGTNRISINIGKEDRYLLFVNLSLDDLVAALEAPENSDPNRVVSEFFRAYPEYPVTKIKIRPGEAYIAPTENIIHDGIGAKVAADLNLTFCGHIGFPPPKGE